LVGLTIRSKNTKIRIFIASNKELAFSAAPSKTRGHPKLSLTLRACILVKYVGNRLQPIALVRQKKAPKIIITQEIISIIRIAPKL
jgi:hypothetical protein